MSQISTFQEQLATLQEKKNYLEQQKLNIIIQLLELDNSILSLKNEQLINHNTLLKKQLIDNTETDSNVTNTNALQNINQPSKRELQRVDNNLNYFSLNNPSIGTIFQDFTKDKQLQNSKDKINVKKTLDTEPEKLPSFSFGNLEQCMQDNIRKDLNNCIKKL
jgi:hypothetical protein